MPKGSCPGQVGSKVISFLGSLESLSQLHGCMHVQVAALGHESADCD